MSGARMSICDAIIIFDREGLITASIPPRERYCMHLATWS